MKQQSLGNIELSSYLLTLLVLREEKLELLQYLYRANPHSQVLSFFIRQDVDVLSSKHFSSFCIIYSCPSAAQIFHSTNTQHHEALPTPFSPRRRRSRSRWVSCPITTRETIPVD